MSIKAKKLIVRRVLTGVLSLALPVSISTATSTNEQFLTIEEPVIQDKEAKINQLISLFKLRDVDTISQYVSYPLKQTYPLPNINNKQEFIEAFDTILPKIYLLLSQIQRLMIGNKWVGEVAC